MTKRIALLDDTGVVANVAVFADDWVGETWDGHSAVTLPADSAVSPGWTYGGSNFVAPPVLDLTAPGSIKATDTALVTFTDTYSDAPPQVVFTVNGASTTVALTDGTAQLDVTPSGAGDITVSVDQPVPPLTITVEA